MKILKKALANLFVFTLILSLVGCGDNSWSVKAGDNSLAPGVYIYYLSSAYSSAYNKVEDNTDVLGGQVDGENATDWIKAEALKSCKKLLATEKKFDELKLSLTDEDLTTADARTDSTWGQYQSAFEGFGVSRDSYHRATSLFVAKYEKVYEYYYGDNGKEKISDDDLKKYFIENYTDYSYIKAEMLNTDGSTSVMSDSEKDKMRSKFKSYADAVNKGKTLEEVAKTYKSDYSVEGENIIESGVEILDDLTSMDDKVKEAIKKLKSGKAEMFEYNNSCYVLYKGDINKAVQKTLSDKDKKEDVLLAMKSKKFSDMIDKLVEKMEFSVNNSIIKKYKPTMFVPDK